MIDLTEVRVHLDKLEKVDKSYESVISKISEIIRNWFPNLHDLEHYEWVIGIVNGDRVKQTFANKLKETILDTFPTEDREIIDEANESGRYQRDKTERQIFLTKEKKKILDRVRQRYNRIIIKTYGPKCGGCKSKLTIKYHTDCACVTGICVECLGSTYELEPDKAKFHVKCPVCMERIRHFTCVENKTHTLTSLFKIQELEDDEQDDEQDDDIESFWKKRRTSVSPASSLPVSSSSSSLPASFPSASSPYSSSSLSSSSSSSASLPVQSSPPSLPASSSSSSSPVPSSSSSLPVSSSLREENRVLQQRINVLEAILNDRDLEIKRLNNLLRPNSNSN